MSSRPNRSCACRTAAKAASRSVTSSLIGRIASPYLATRSSSVAVSRAVAATLSPRSRAAIAHSRPKPRDVPVMNQVFMDALPLGLVPYNQPRGKAFRTGPPPGRRTARAGQVEPRFVKEDQDLYFERTVVPPPLAGPAGVVSPRALRSRAGRPGP